MTDEKFAQPLSINEEMAKEVLSKEETYPFVIRVLEENCELVRRLEDQQRELNSRHEYIRSCERVKLERWIENKRLTQENEKLRNNLAELKADQLVAATAKRQGRKK